MRKDLASAKHIWLEFWKAGSENSEKRIDTMYGVKDKRSILGTSLVVQWLRLMEGPGFDPWSGN